MKLSIIIVSWNVSDLLQKCLASIYQQTQGLEFEVFIIDNASKDNTTSMIREKFPQVKLIASKENLGFAKANNLGLAQAQGQYILFMNPDMELIENSFLKLTNLLDKDPQIALATGQLVYPDGQRQNNVKNNPSLCDQLLILLKLHHIFKPSCLNKFLDKNFDYSQQQEVKQIMGAFILGRKEILKKINGWDEDYYLWWEDLDLCKRIQNIDGKIFYTPHTQIIHHEAKSFAQNSSLLRQKRFNRGMRIFFKKHHSTLSYLIICLFSPVSLFLAWLSQLLKIKPKTQSKI